MSERANQPQIAQGIVWGVLGLALLAAATDLPTRWSLLGPTLDEAGTWGDAAAQYRAQVAPAPFDLLRQADALLPPDATVLLVTPGADIGYEEYNTFHRALYFLAPRPVWWLAPTPSNGTWKARWWIAAPLTAESVRAVAAEKHASYVLAYKTPALPVVGRPVADLGAGALWQLDDGPPPAPGPPRQPLYPGPGWPFQLAAALAGLLLLGRLVLAAAARFGYRPGALESWALAWPLGAGLASVLMLGLGALGLQLPAQIAVVSGATVLAAGGLALGSGKGGARRHFALTRRGTRPRSPRAPRWSWGLVLRVLLGAVLAGQILSVAVQALGRPLTVWDSWVNWGMKARLIFMDGHVSPALYADPSRAVTLQDYPLLVPQVEAWIYGWLGALDDRLVGSASLLFYLALIGLCYTAARQHGAGVNIALATAAVVATVGEIAILAGIVFAELPLALFTVIAAVYLLRWLSGGPGGALVVAAAGAGFMAWTKREGLVILAALVLAALLVGRSRRAWAGAGALVLGAAVLAGPWWSFVAWQQILDPAFAPMTLATFLANADRWPTILRLTRSSLFSPGSGYLWPLALGGGLLLQRGRRPEDLLPVTALLYLAATGFVYVFSVYVPFEQHILSSIDRLIAEVTPLLVLWVVFRGCGAGREERLTARGQHTGAGAVAPVPASTVGGPV